MLVGIVLLRNNHKPDQLYKKKDKQCEKKKKKETWQC